MITEDYVSFEVAKLLKEKGFNEPCHATYDIAVTGGKPKFSEYEVLSFFPYGMRNTDDKYNMVISAPTLQMTMKWLKEVHYLWINIDPLTGYKWTWSIWFMNEPDKNMGESLQSISTYEEACEAAIKYCLEYLI